MTLLFAGGSWQGGTDYGTMMRWQNLISDPQTMHKVTNIRWTELAANMVTGAKSRAGSNSGATSAVGEILMYRKRVTYRYQFGIAAFLCCVLWLAYTTACLYMLCVPERKERILPSTLSTMINTLSVGRLLVWKQSENGEERQGLFGVPTKEWLSRDGKKVIDLPVGAGDGYSEIKGEHSTGGDAGL